MLWPSFADYELFVKNAFEHSVLDPRLKNGKPMKGISGGFARVYPVEVASDTFALRCWVKDVGNLKDRYEKISAYLKQVHLPYFVDFEYVPKGILVNETRYPITRMEWVEGVSLRQFIERNLQNPHIFKVVADEFQKMVASLHKHQIAHGDLQNGNILLTKNNNAVEIKLIDYDSLFVPKLRGQPEQIVGLPEYQHPIRITGGGQVNEKADYFSELVIYLSFLSLAEKPELWNRFKGKTERGLLFSKNDFANPDQSDVFQELANLSPDVQQLAATLKNFCTRTSLDELDPLEAVLPNPPKTIWQKITDIWQHVISGLKNNQRLIPAGLSLALIICFVAFLTQMDAKNVALLQSTELTKKLNQKESEIHQQQLAIQDLTSSIQTLKSANQKLSRDIGELENKLRDGRSGANVTTGDTVSLRRQRKVNRELRTQLSKKNADIRQLQNDKAAALNENRELKKQLVGSDHGVANQTDTIQRLQREKKETLTKNLRLQAQLAEKTSEARKLNSRVQQLEAEKIEIQRQNQKLQRENEVLARQTRNSRDKNAALPKQQNETHQMDTNTVVAPEPPEKIQDYSEIITRAGSHNNQGCLDFKANNYSEAVKQFGQAIKTASKFAVAHYNLGCVYLKMREYGKAINAFSEAVGIDHKFKEAYYNLGLAHLGKGDRQAAKNSVKLALRIDKNYQRARNFLTTIEEAQQ